MGVANTYYKVGYCRDDRHLKGEANFPANHKMMSLEEAIEARDKWQKFVNAQDERLRRVARKKRR